MTTATLAAPIGTRRRYYPAVTTTVPRLARAWAQRQLAELGASPDLTYTALLVISELITNVNRHAPGEADLTLGLEDGHLVITCADRGTSTLPQLDHPDPDSETGRGLLLVHTLCANVWTRRRLGNGKRIIACLTEEATA